MTAQFPDVGSMSFNSGRDSFQDSSSRSITRGWPRTMADQPERHRDAGLSSHDSHSRPLPGSEAAAPRGFGLVTGVRNSSEHLINDFCSNLNTMYPGFSGNEPAGVDYLGDFNFNAAIDDEAVSAPTSANFSSGRAALGILPASHALSRNESQNSHVSQDDAASVARTSTSTGEDFSYPLRSGFNPLISPGTSYSQDTLPQSLPLPWPHSSPDLNVGWIPYEAPDSLYDTSFIPAYDDAPTVSYWAEPFSATCSIPVGDPGTEPDPNSGSISLGLDHHHFNAISDPHLEGFGDDLLGDELGDCSVWGAGPVSAQVPEWQTGLTPFPRSIPNDFSLMLSEPYEDALAEEPAMAPTTPTINQDQGSFDPGGPSFWRPHHTSFGTATPAAAPVVSVNRLTVPGLKSSPLRRSGSNRSRQRASSTGSKSPLAKMTLAEGTTRPMPIPVQPIHSTTACSHSLPESTDAFPDKKDRGKRKGPLDRLTRQEAKRTRNGKSICIRCKHSRTGCRRPGDALDAPCILCEDHAETTKWPGPCVKAYFEDLIMAGSLDYEADRFVEHLAGDGTQRVRKEISAGFDLGQMLRDLDEARGRFDLKVWQGGKTVYKLELDRCYSYLAKVFSQLDNSGGPELDFHAFIDRELIRVDPKTDGWRLLMRECMLGPGRAAGDNKLALLCILSFAPTRATFSYLFKGHPETDLAPGKTSSFRERRMDVESPEEERYLLLAARLARIVARRIEVEAYLQLQQMLHDALNNPTKYPPRRLVMLLQRLGRILVLLRWRFSWWAVSGGSSWDDELLHPGQVDPGIMGSFEEPDSARESCQVRVLELCRCLYFYFCCIRRKLPMFLTPQQAKALRGVQSLHPDGSAGREPVWDGFPVKENEAGFAAWMAEGRELAARIKVEEQHTAAQPGPELDLL